MLCVVRIHTATFSTQRKSQVPASGISEKLYPYQIRLNRDCSSRLVADSALEVIRLTAERSGWFIRRALGIVAEWQGTHFVVARQGVWVRVLPIRSRVVALR